MSRLLQESALILTSNQDVRVTRIGLGLRDGDLLGDPKVVPDQFESFLRGGDGAFELSVLDGGEHDFHLRARLVARGHEVVAGEQARRAELVRGQRGELFFDELPVRKAAVAAEAIEAVEGEVLVETVHADEAFQRARVHLLSAHEAHVIGDEGEDLSDGVVGVAEPAKDFARDFDAGFGVAVEAYAIGGEAERGWFADVVEQDAEGEFGRGILEAFEHE